MAALIRPRVGLLICNYTTYVFLYLQIFLLGFLILVVIASTASREKYSHWVQQNEPTNHLVLSLLVRIYPRTAGGIIKGRCQLNTLSFG